MVKRMNLKWVPVLVTSMMALAAAAPDDAVSRVRGGRDSDLVECARKFLRPARGLRLIVGPMAGVERLALAPDRAEAGRWSR